MLTKKQKNLLIFINRKIRSTGISPSYEEMKNSLNLKSKSGIHRLISALEERGFVKRLAHKARALEVVKLPENASANDIFNTFTPSVIKGGLDKNEEDFGQTLAVWGVPDGPYLVLPGLGPSTMRDTLSMIPDAFLTPLWLIDHDRTAYSLTAIDLVDTRARYLGLESIVIGDEYLFFRDAYLQSREFEILDGQVDDDFDEFDDFN